MTSPNFTIRNPQTQVMVHMTFKRVLRWAMDGICFERLVKKLRKNGNWTIEQLEATLLVFMMGLL